jgi:glycine dehydrogenase subunit 1
VQHPNFFGCLEDVAALAKIAHDAGALLVQSFDPISLGALERPGDLGADVAVAEGQSLGTPLLYGGPYLGIMACREQFVRRMPGRIAGQTVDRRGRRCWVLTLQTREQHIRREKATSNICTNQGLAEGRGVATVGLAACGMADLCLQTHAAQRCQNDRCKLMEQPFFKEFVVRDRLGQVPLCSIPRQAGILAGCPWAAGTPS